MAVGVNSDRDIVRGLAGELAEIASRPCQREKIEGWKKINSLGTHRPMLWITEIPWGELEGKVEEITPVCKDEQLRALERELRRKLFTARRLSCDEVVSRVFYVPRVIAGMDRDFGVEGREDVINQPGGTHIRSHHYRPVISEPEDIEKIKMPRLAYDRRRTLERRAVIEDLLGDLLDVEISGPRVHWFNGWDLLVRWTGVTEALTDMALRPEFIHALMRRLTDAFLSRMDQLQELDLLDHPHPQDRIGSGGAGYTDELPQPDHDPDHIRTIDQWGGATAQIFSEVSPAMHEEFALKYEKEIMQRCGLNYYGCCEPLHAKMHILAGASRLRKISISPWCDVEKAVENAEATYVFSHKPSPAVLAEDSFNPQRAERDIRRRIARSGGMPCEFVMKDISTVRGDVDRLIAWCEMAYRIVREGE